MIEKIPELNGVRQKYQEEIDMLYEAMDNDLLLNDLGEHPEMHRYEIAQDGIRWEYIDAIYKAGYIRIGYFNDKGIGTITFEGDKNVLKARKNDLLRFAKDYDCVAKIAY